MKQPGESMMMGCLGQASANLLSVMSLAFRPGCESIALTPSPLFLLFHLLVHLLFHHLTGLLFQTKFHLKSGT